MVKLGGSLLDLDDVIDRLLVAVSDIAMPVVVTGGGSAADLVRQWDRDGLLTDTEAHQLAISAMSFHAQRLAESDDRLALAASRVAAVRLHREGRVPLIDAMAVLRDEEGRRTQFPPLPHSWDVTSDSIAAWLARAWCADLRLLKSVDPRPGNPDVDPWFQTAAAGISRISWVNLRSAADVVISPGELLPGEPRLS